MKKRGFFFVLSFLLPVLFFQTEKISAQESAETPDAADPAVEDTAAETPAAVTPSTGASAAGSYSYVEKDGEEVRFVQHFSWEAQLYARRYEVSVEVQEEDGSYTEFTNGSTEDSYIEFSLPVGFYRYSIQVYDLLGRPSGEPRWTEIEVMLALQPQIDGFSPENFYLDEDYIWEINLRGENLLPRSQLYLRPVGVNESIRHIVPSRYTPAANGRSARLEFIERQLVPGRYEVYSINPGGLDSVRGVFTIAYRKPFDFNLSLGWSPAISVAGEFNKFISIPLHPLGFTFKASFMFFKRPWGYFGAEIAPSYFYISRKGSDYDFYTHIPSLHLNAIYQMWLNRIMALNFRLGPGMTSIYKAYFDFGSAGTSPPFTNMMISVNVGASFMWFVRKPFFLEAGIEYIQAFSSDAAWPGYIRPFISAGYQF
jgi:hypothetical protein